MSSRQNGKYEARATTNERVTWGLSGPTGDTGTVIEVTSNGEASDTRPTSSAELHAYLREIYYTRGKHIVIIKLLPFDQKLSECRSIIKVNDSRGGTKGSEKRRRYHYWPGEKTQKYRFTLAGITAKIVSTRKIIYEARITVGATHRPYALYWGQGKIEKHLCFSVNARHGRE